MELLDKVLSDHNLIKAIDKVVKNGGSAGIDGMSVKEGREYFLKHKDEIINKLKTRTYKPQPVKRVEIPKPDGGLRNLGIPCIIDRILQQAINQVLTPIYEKQFCEYSYGFRPNRDAHMAINKSLEYLNEGYNIIVDIDLEKFFDKVNHDKLMQVLNNIYKIVIVNIIVFLVSILLTYVLTDILLTAIWAIVLSFLFCVVSLSLIYLFLSWIDRSRYEEDTVEDLESTQITFTKTSVIIGITLIVLNFISTSLSLFQHFTISHIINNFMSMESVLGKFVLLQSNIQVYLRIFIAVIFILLLINMTRYVIENSKTNQSLKIFIIFELVKLAFSYIQRFILTIMSVNENVNVYRYITSENSILNNLISLTNGVIILILILMITKEFKVNQVVIVIPSLILFQKLVVILLNRFINLNFWIVLTYQISFILGTALTFVYMLVNKSKRLDLIKYNF